MFRKGTQGEKAKDLSRRDLLRGIGLAGTGALAAPLVAGCRQPPWERVGPDPTGRALDKPYVPGAERYGIFEERWFNSSCGQCPAGCGVRVRVVEGRAVRIEGNPENPLNQGGIGPRGLAALQALYDPDRLKGPLARQGGRLVAISWDEAIPRLTERLAALRRQAEPHKLLVWSGQQRGLLLELFARFCRAFGTPNLVDGRPSRTSVMSQAMQATVGSFEIPAFDWSGADYVVSFEAGLLEDSCQAVFFARAAGELRRGSTGYRAKLVHAGPSFDLSAHNADEWIKIRPGTGGALALGLCHILCRENRFNETFVGSFTAGFDTGAAGAPGFRRFLDAFTPERTAEITGAPPEAVVRLAREIAAVPHAFGFVDDRSLSYSNGWHTALAVLALNAMLGSIERRTGGLRVEPRPPYAEWPPFEPDAIASAGLAEPRLDRAGRPEFPLARAVHETIPEAILASGAARPEVAILHHANPLYARHQPGRWRSALRAIPFIVSFSPYRDETVDELADLVLPDHTYLERWGDAANAPGLGRIVAGVQRPVIEPLYDTRSTGDVLLALGRSLGGSVAQALPWHSFREAMEVRLRGLRAATQGNIVALDERTFLHRMFEEGFWAEREPPASRMVRFQFHPEWAEPEWPGDASAYPVKLLVYRPLGYAEGSGVNQPFLRFLRSRPDTKYWRTPASVHPDSAPEGVHGDEQNLVVTSPWGAITVPARLDHSMPRGYVAIPLGGGHTAFGRFAVGFGQNPMRLVAPGAAPRTGAGVLSNTRVRLELAGAAAPGRATREA